MLTSFIARVRRRFVHGSADSAKSENDAPKGVFSRGAVVMVAGLVLVGTFATIHAVHADTAVMDTVALFLASMTFICVSFVGQLLLIMVSALVWVAQYNGFVDSAAVAQGWSIVRDITNMFFILVLLVYAFGTILGVDKWSYKNGHLTRLLIMAVVVNFSRTICGLLIDFAQVVMLTFVYGFKDAAGGNFVDAFALTKILQDRPNLDQTNGAWGVAVAMLLALAMTIISLLIVIGMTITLAIRIVTLWLLIVVSPLAFFTSAVPGSIASGIYGKWWSKFAGAVVIGPMMAFTLWLSLMAVATPDFASRGFPTAAAGGAGSETISGEMSAAFQDSEIEKFIISICLLIVGWQMSQKMSDDISQYVPSGKDAGAMATRGLKAAGRGMGMAGRGAYAAGDAVSGGRLTRAKESALETATAIPLVRGYAGRSLSESRSARKASGEEEKKFIAGLSPDAKKNFAKAAAWTPDQKARKKEALRATLNDAATKPPTDQKGREEFYAQRKELSRLGEDLKDSSVKEEIGKIEQKRPSLIIDPNEKDPAERKRQEESFRKAARGVNENKILDMDAEELDEKFLAFASPKAILGAQNKASGDQLEKLAPMGDTVEKIAQKQRELRSGAESFRLMAEQDRAEIVKGMDARQLGDLASSDRIRPEHLGGAVLDAAAAAGTAGVIADKVANQLTPDQLRNNPNLAKQIAEGISASRLGNVAGDVASVLMPLVASHKDENGNIVGDTGKALLGGATMDQAFGGYGKDGSFDTPENRQNFEEYLQDGITSKRAGSVPSSAIGANGGINDVTISIINNVTGADLTAMAKDGKADQVAGILAAAEKLGGINTNDQATVDKFITGNSGLTSNEAQLRAAFTKAAQLVAETAGKSNPIAAASKENNLWKEAQREAKESSRAARKAARDSESTEHMTRKLFRDAERRRKGKG